MTSTYSSILTSPIAAWIFLGFEREVEELIGYTVEVGTQVHTFVRERVDAQAVPL